MDSFFARNDGWGLNNRELFESVQKSEFLVQACSSLIRHPVASRKRKAVFLSKETFSLNLFPLFKKSKTLFKLHVGADMGLLCL